MPWYHDIDRDQWRVLAAAQLGWILDAMDVLLYSFALTAIRSEFQLSSAAAGALSQAAVGAARKKDCIMRRKFQRWVKEVGG